MKYKKILIIVITLIAIGIIYFIYNNEKSDDTIQIDENILIANSTNASVIASSDDTEEDIIIVHITGAVKTPGVVKLKEGARMEDAINLAGGLLEDADISNVNLAYVLEDGIKIKIPSISDTEALNDDIISEESGEGIIQDLDTNTSSSKEININTATESEFQTLPGIGPALATRIVEYRNSNGKFSAIEDIKNVSGIGDSKYENIKDLICVK